MYTQQHYLLMSGESLCNTCNFSVRHIMAFFVLKMVSSISAVLLETKLKSQINHKKHEDANVYEQHTSVEGLTPNQEVVEPLGGRA